MNGFLLLFSRLLMLQRHKWLHAPLVHQESTSAFSPYTYVMQVYLTFTVYENSYNFKALRDCIDSNCTSVSVFIDFNATGRSSDVPKYVHELWVMMGKGNEEYRNTEKQWDLAFFPFLLLEKTLFESHSLTHLKILCFCNTACHCVQEYEL